MTGVLTEEDRIRAILTAQATTAHQLKQARARLVVRYLRAGMKSAEMWAQVEIETAELAERAALADVEAKVLWWTRGPIPDDEGQQSSITEGDLFE